jgi:chromosome partitioning protein
MHTIAISTQKGGVAKTASSVNIAACIAEMGKKVLVIDLDAQASACICLGLPEQVDEGQPTIADVLIQKRPLSEAIRKTPMTGVDAVHAPGYGTSTQLAGMVGGHARLRQALSSLSGYDLVVVDCPTGMGPLTLAGMVAASHVIVPLICDYLGLQALRDQMTLIGEIREGYPPGPEVLGVLPTMIERRAIVSQVLVEVQKAYPQIVLPAIRRAVAVPESAARRAPLPLDAPKEGVTDDYRQVAKIVMARLGLGELASPSAQVS